MINNVTTELIEKVKKEERNSIFEFLFGIALFFSVGTAMYFRDSGMKFWCESIGLFIMICIYLYARTIRKSKIIVSTIKEFEINDQYILFTTFSFKLLLFFKMGNIKYSVKKSDVNVYKTYYPLKKLFDVNENAFKIAINNEGFFILNQYFDTDIEDFLHYRKTSLYEQ